VKPWLRAAVCYLGMMVPLGSLWLDPGPEERTTLIVWWIVFGPFVIFANMAVCFSGIHADPTPHQRRQMILGVLRDSVVMSAATLLILAVTGYFSGAAGTHMIPFELNLTHR
jgi:uncharacterized membrane protein